MKIPKNINTDINRTPIERLTASVFANSKVMNELVSMQSKPGLQKLYTKSIK